jgi:hypothetical protein
VNVSNYTYSASSSIEVSFTANADATIRLVLFQANDWVQYGADAIATGTAMTANTEFTQTIDMTGYADVLADVNSFDLGFYFDMNEATAKKKVTVNKLTVDGVSYQATAYDPTKDVEVSAPATSFKAYTEWTGNNGTVSANTLENMPDTDERYATAVSEGAGNFTITDPTQAASLEIPLSETFETWPSDWTTLYVKVKANNVSQINAYIETITEDDSTAFCFGLLGAWNAKVTASVSDGYKYATISLSSYFTSYKGSISKLVFAPVVKDTTAAASFEIAGMTFGTASDEPVFINDVGSPALTIGEWTNNNGASYDITADGTLTVDENTEYKGLKISYTREQASQWGNVAVDVSNFDAARYPTLQLGFYADTALKLGIYNGNAALQGHTEYAAGYHTVSIDVSAITDTSLNLFFYIDSSETTAFEGTKTIVFDKIFFREGNVSIALDDAYKDGLYDLTATKDSVSWTYDAANAGLFYCVSIPVDNWYSTDRFVIVNVTLTESIKFGIYFNNASLLEHVLLGAGTYNLCLDTAFGYQSEYLTDNGENIIKFYCDTNNTAADSIIKGVTINSITFANAGEGFVSSPDSAKAAIDYVNETLTIAEGYEASLTEDFATLLTANTVTPGSTIYLRAANNGSAVTSFTVAARPVITAENAPTVTIGDNFIRFGASGYEYKLGDGEWLKLGSWGDLQAGTEYTVSIRQVSTSTSFASEVYTMTVKTTGGATSDTDSSTSSDTTANTSSSTTSTSNATSSTSSSSKKSGCGASVALGGMVGVITLLGGALFARKRKDD